MPEAGAPARPRVNPRTVALIVACGMFMDQLDSTVLTTAVPAIARSFNADPLHLSLALTAYLLSLAVFIPVSGRVADRFGSRTVFQAAIVLFTLGSMLCGQANGLAFLVVSRFIQGAGGAMMVPVGRLVLLRTASKAELVSAMSWLLLPANIGPMVGPPFGGLIVTYLSWRWIFYINVPIGLVGLALSTRFVPQFRQAAAGRFDLFGFLCTAMALPSLIFGLELATRGTGGAISYALLAFGFLVGGIYIWHARRVVAPVLDLALLRLQTFHNSIVAGSLSRIMIGSIPFLLPLMLQLGFGMSAAASGMIGFAPAFGSLVAKPVVAPVLRLVGFRRMIMWCGFAAVFVTALCAAFRPGWPSWLMMLVLAISGFLISMQFMSYNTLAYAEIPPERMSAATSFYATFQQFFITVGIAGSAGALAVSERVSGHAVPTLRDFSIAFLLCAGIALVAPLITARLSGSAGREVSGHRGRPPLLTLRVLLHRRRRLQRQG